MKYGNSTNFAETARQLASRISRPVRKEVRIPGFDAGTGAQEALNGGSHPPATLHIPHSAQRESTLPDTPTHAAGLVNLDQSCYQNATIQCLANCNDFVRHLDSVPNVTNEEVAYLEGQFSAMRRRWRSTRKSAINKFRQELKGKKPFL